MKCLIVHTRTQTAQTHTHHASIQTCQISSWPPTTHCAPFPNLPHIFDPEARECRVETGQMRRRWSCEWQRLSVCAVCPDNLLMYSWGQEVLLQINGRDLHSFPLECAWSALLSTAGGENIQFGSSVQFSAEFNQWKVNGGGGGLRQPPLT